MNKKMLNEWRPRFAEAIAAVGYEMLDVEYVTEEGEDVLRFYIYRPEGITIDDCEMVSHALSPKLDEWDPIDTHYLLQVSSPDLSRPLTTDRQLEIACGEELEINLYQKKNGSKHFVATLVDFDAESIYFKQNETPIDLKRTEIAQLKIHLTF